MGGSGRIIQLEILGCLLHYGALNLALASQAIEYGDDDGLGIDVEVAACALASIGEAEAIRTQGDVGTRDVRADLLLQLGGEVRDANERTLVALELGGSKCLGRLLALAQGLLVAAGTVAGQFVPEASGIVNDPNDWADEVGNPRYIVELIGKVTRVAMETVRIVDGLAEEGSAVES